MPEAAWWEAPLLVDVYRRARSLDERDKCIVRPGRRGDPREQARVQNPDKTRMAGGRHEG